MQSDPPGEVTALLQQVGRGDSTAIDRLIPLVSATLQRLPAPGMINRYASHHGSAHPDEVCSTLPIPRLITDKADISLVHECSGLQRVVGPFAPQLFPQFVQRQRHGCGRRRRAFGQAIAGTRRAATGARPAWPMSPRQRQVVELRYFGGLSPEETAEVLKVSPITVKRDWLAAKAWLKGQIRRPSPD